jgi:aminomethyltransferase
MVVNASNREKILAWLREHGDLDRFGFEDRTTATAMIAIQGPRAIEIVDRFSADPPSQLAYYHGMSTEVCGVEALVSRTGYTGEDGCEVIVDAEHGEQVWSEILEAASAEGGCAVGLAARDTLRLEAGMPLYGHELTEDINPATADVDFAINLKGRNFPGSEAIAAARADSSLPRRVGLELDGRRPAREHSWIWNGDRQIGEVTSGTFSPTLGKPIAMAYVDARFTSPGTNVEIDVRGTRLPARVCALPFYKRSR